MTKKPKPVNRKKKPKTQNLKTVLYVIALLGLLFDGGYYLGRFARPWLISPRPKVESVPRLVQGPNGTLSAQLDVPGGYAIDETNVPPTRDRVSRWIDRLVDDDTELSFWTLYPVIANASERASLRTFISRERLFFSAFATVSFAKGFFLGLETEPEAVRNPEVKPLEAKRNLLVALQNLGAVSYGEKDAETDPRIRTIRRELTTLELRNPELRQIKN
jgi:hypothetical protein